MFTAMDTDNSGQITFDELKEGLRKYGSTLKDTEIRDLMDAVSQLQFKGYAIFTVHTLLCGHTYSLLMPICQLWRIE